MYSLLSSLLARDVDRRLGCMGRGSFEVREHEFFTGIDWQLVYHRKYTPPLIPPRGEVNAADAFDIGSFDEEDTKYIKLTESDLEPYKDFPLVVSERWQLEIAETVFDVVNQETDRMENKRRSKQSQSQQSQSSSSSSANTSSTLLTPPHVPSSSSSNNHKSSESTGGESSVDSLNSDCIVEGDILKLVGPFFQTWQRKFLRLFPNRLEMYSKSRDGTVVKKGVELISMVDIREISPTFQRMYKMDNCLTIVLKNDSKIVITSSDKILINQWKEEIEEAFQISNELISNLNKKAHKVYGADSPPLQPSTPDQIAIGRTPTKSGGSSTESSSCQGLVRQTTVPVTTLQKSLTKLYSITATSSTSSGMTVTFDKSPARSQTAEPITEKEADSDACQSLTRGQSFSSSSETLSNLCSNASCSYPFESYDGLLSSLQQSSAVNCVFDSSLELNLDFLELPESDGSSTNVQNSRTLEQSSSCVNNVNTKPSISQHQGQKPCAVLPRYLIESNNDAGLTPREFSHSPDSDSGISTTSAMSNLSYKEVLTLRAQKSKNVNSVARPVRPVSLLERKHSANTENILHESCSSNSIETHFGKQKSMKERIAEVTERLSAPLERRRRNSIPHSPIQSKTRNGTIQKQRQSSLPRRRVKLPTSMIVAPPGQRFEPLSPEVSIKNYK
ncbi:unnamed protein product [Rodentolepis nana]|uniref:G protein-coupled receptor kinase n=1 Tax=Rodentolepis nana TaxID=102285 RepID=A0A0R3TWF0_RODNA|nr:unnamed protein product [Rodentolepis nana]